LKEIDERWGIAIVINDLGLVATKIGEYAEAKRLLQESLATFREIGNREGMVFSLINLSAALLELGEHGAARQLLQESLALCSEAGDRLGSARALKNLGLVALAMADDSEAARCFHEALKTAMDIQALPVALEVLAEMASLARRAGNDRQAIELLTLAVHHPTSSRETKDRAQRLLAELASRFPADVTRTVEEHSKTRQLAEMVAAVLGM
jgi:tetratricopeptide (TPR) repeat protein